MRLLKKLLNEKFLVLLIEALMPCLAKQIEEQLGISSIWTMFILKAFKALIEKVFGKSDGTKP